MAGNTKTAARRAGGSRFGTRERRRATPHNQAVRRTVDVLGWAAELPPDPPVDAREVLRKTHDEAIAALRRTGRFASPRELKPLSLPAALFVATFVLGLGIGLTFGGAT